MHPELPNLEAARLRAGLTVDELWVRYFGNGGTATLVQFRGLLARRTWRRGLQYDVAVSALNDRFTEMDLDHPLRYSISSDLD